jgi:hypothetical protein
LDAKAAKGEEGRDPDFLFSERTQPQKSSLGGLDLLLAALASKKTRSRRRDGSGL